MAIYITLFEKYKIKMRCPRCECPEFISIGENAWRCRRCGYILTGSGY